ncbi:acid protease [Suhomyces tanzawaensis NRRL Y-17324]|uniref:candidapepsin n=1 Tax=Suhomyces tanzawaensis NRRL Y-17324 TaxID=984487 RepID=A0A1E4SLW1_9ASCO|nr:acid protease [Suhomyces tanzawaensis NRRL Y-17324]ODV80500.1 acid protease [Suhomyces tanzawaensis NRRL Y-17324]
MIPRFIFSYQIFLALALLVGQGLALPTGDAHNQDLISLLTKRDTGSKFILMGFSVARNSDSEQPTDPLVSLNGAVSSPIDNKLYHYNIDLEVGSNKQKITVDVDTGSSDFWVVATDATCQKGRKCKAQGTYNASQSNTSKDLNQPFLLGYIDGSTTSGTYYLDDITLPGGITAKQAQFANANTTSSPFAILGIGLKSLEAPILAGGTQTYDNFPWVLKNQGFINKAAYSLFLSSPSAESGTLLFGGIDNAKFEGPLYKLSGAFPSRLGVKLDSIAVDGGVTDSSTGFVFDSGYSYSSWPKATADAIGSALQGSSQSGNSWLADCTQPNKTITLNFGNGAKQIRVPYSSFIAPEQKSTGTCSTTIGYSVDGNYDNLPTFGDDVLRSFYVVYDIEENSLQIAQAVYTSQSDVTAIE